MPVDRIFAAADRAPVAKICELNSYLSDIDRTSVKLDRVRIPFSKTESSSSRLPTRLPEQMMDVSSVCGLKMKHADKILSQCPHLNEPLSAGSNSNM